MKRAAAAFLVVSALPFPVSGQQRDRSLERMSLALHDPPVLRDSGALDSIQVSSLRILGVPIMEPVAVCRRLAR